MNTIQLSWTDLKNVVANKNLSLQYYTTDTNFYHIWIEEGHTTYECRIKIDIPPNSDQQDFEDNFKIAANTAVIAKATVQNTGEGNVRFFKFLTTGSAIAGTVINSLGEKWVLADGDTLKVKVDGGSEQTATFNTGDFADIASAEATEVAAALNTDITGQTSTAIGGPGSQKVKITSDTTGLSSSIEVTGGTGNRVINKLFFPINFNVGSEGSRDMNIDSDQSVTLFSITADATVDTFIEKIAIMIQDQSTSYDKFGGVPQVLSGIELFYTQGGERKDIIEQATVLSEVARFSEAKSTEILLGVSENVFIATFTFPQTVHLPAGSSDMVVMRIQDDFTGINLFRTFVEGFTRA